MINSLERCNDFQQIPAESGVGSSGFRYGILGQPPRAAC